MLGGTLELIALGWMNVGAAQSPDSALASIISAILVIVGHQSIATGIAIALPVAAAGRAHRFRPHHHGGLSTRSGQGGGGRAFSHY